MTEQIRKKKKKVDKELIFFLLFAVTVPVLHWFIFYVYPNISSVGMAFMNSEGHLSFENFQRLWIEFQLPTSQIRLALINTMKTFAIVLIIFIPQVLVSYFIYRKVPGAGIFRVLFFLPSVLVPICVSLVFKQVVSTASPIATVVQDVLNLEHVPELLADSRFANIVILLNMVWLSFPGDLIIWGGTFARIPEDMLEAARIDGVNWWREFTKIIVPLVWPTVALKMVLTVCGFLGASGNVFLLTRGEYGTMTLNAWMYITLLNNSGSKYTSNVYNFLSAIGLVMTAISVCIAFVVRKYTDKAFDDVDF